MPDHVVKVGDVLDERYAVSEVLRSGTMASVVRATDRLTGDEVACKIPRDDALGSTEALRSQRGVFLGLRNRVFPMLLAYERDSNRRFEFMVLEYVRGESIADWARDKSRRQRLCAAAEIAEGLAQLVRAGAAHGDVHSGNVMVAADRIVLIDPEPFELGLTGTESQLERARRADRLGFASLLDELLPGGDGVAVAGIIERLVPPPPRRGSRELAPTSLADAAAALRNLLELPFVAGDLDGPVEALAGYYLERRATDAAAYVALCNERDLVFRNVRQVVSGLAESFGGRSRHGAQTLSDDDLLRTELEAGLAGQLSARSLEFEFEHGDTLQLVFDAAGSFRKPWPNPATPGLLSAGSLVLRRGNELLLCEKLELWTRDRTPMLFVRRADELQAFDKAVVERALRVLCGQVFVGVPHVESGSQRAIALSPDRVPREYLSSRSSAGVGGGLFMAARPNEFLRSAIEATFRPQHFVGAPGDQRPLSQFFNVADAAKPKVIEDAVRVFRTNLGPFFSPIYQIDFSIVSPTERILRVAFAGKIANGSIISHTFEFSMPTPQMIAAQVTQHRTGGAKGSLRAPRRRRRTT